jgi:hypothetical protein
MKIDTTTIVTALDGRPMAARTEQIDHVNEDGKVALLTVPVPLVVGEAIRMALESQPVDERTSQPTAPTMAEILKRLELVEKLKSGGEVDFAPEDLVKIQDLARTSLSVPVVLFLVKLFRSGGE